jgi:hypothetical protein
MADGTRRGHEFFVALLVPGRETRSGRVRL